MDERARLIVEVRETNTAVARLFADEQLGSILKVTLTMPQLKLMTVLRIDGPMSGNELAERLSVSTPTISGMVERLVARGMLERRSSAEDRRVRLVALSRRGAELIADLEEAGWRTGHEVLKEMDLPGLRALAEGLASLAAAVDRLAGPEPGAEDARP